MSDFRVEHLPIAELKPNPANARRHSRKQLHQITASIREFGFNSIVVVDEEAMILVGHGRVEGARMAGLERVPVLRVGHLTAAQKIAFSLADNKIALNSDWDMDQLRGLWRELMGVEINFDVEVTGFETAEIDLLVDGEMGREKPDRSDLVPPVGSDPVSRLGDLWVLGEHRLLCGDACDAASFADLMDGERARLVFTDPPYNVPIDGHVSGLGAVKHREFKMASGEMSSAEFAGFLSVVFGNMAQASMDGAIHFICMDWRHMDEILKAAGGAYSELKNLCVWNKSNGGMGSFYRSKHELVFVYKVGQGPHVNTIELGKHGRYRTNVWDYAGINGFGASRAAELDMHPTVKPTALVIDAIKDCSRRGDIVLDPFSGSGTTIMAAQKSRRRARAIELDLLYVDVAIRRWQAYTGQAATMDLTGETFAQVEQRRADPLQ
ncbi:MULTISPECIES: DNA methyltransferase [unclassified Bradyrhizobium]|uniref:site-specific DNA-methyltransferase n=1 Tax=unclassified Bradyrhizobium TaxID=2631580 RepID=UPI001FF93CE1|nr:MULTISPECIES: DNA methyltransferase [unclassified Bradyrhizobium]MCK1314481.1 ParB N-terminal domain-containing protein [Bradyrhizobium sp. 23]MCK1331286.1 ParB N-terminal domain-containing protein [Bradyrhizobium sp. CW9]MCK1504268.1 ParB N-terminal domain-containing protein [Bradyrhizobium sp. 18]MCK1633515.1 ParB N-terminal domain-containing protein [Bradyrhizobium sp. 162]